MMMNNPLNQAHYQTRKAEQLSAGGKYVDAISCHQKAVEYLDQALGSNIPSCSVESLTLQRDNHIKQQGILRLKNHQHLSRREHARKLAQAKFPEIEVRQEDREPVHRPVKQWREHSDLRHCVQETDTLLNFLGNRRQGSLMTVSEFQGQLHDSAYKKLPKDDRTIIEELRYQNSLLREHVVELLRENDSLRDQAQASQEVDNLVQKVIGQSMMYDSSEPEAFCDLPPGGVDLRADNIDLPPLETPRFEFRSDN